jgi:DNA-binding LacI/PurR family transcriptional regulator
MQGITQTCNSHDLILSLFLFHTADEEKKLSLKVVRQHLVDGVIISASLWMTL